MQTLTGVSNASLLLRYARPGMLGLMASWSSERFIPDLLRNATGWRVVGGDGSPSLWSHCFAVVDRRVRDGWEEITIVESTDIPPEHLLDPAAPGDPDWDGPQRSVILARNVVDGRVRGQDERRTMRRYRDPVHTPNLALFDLGLRGEALAAFQARVPGSLDPALRYAARELVGTLVAGLTGQMAAENPMDSQDCYCSAYVRGLFGGLVPTLDEIPVHVSNTSPELMYQHLQERVPCWQVLRSQRPAAPTLRAVVTEVRAL